MPRKKTRNIVREGFLLAIAAVLFLFSFILLILKLHLAIFLLLSACALCLFVFSRKVWRARFLAKEGLRILTWIIKLLLLVCMLLITFLPYYAPELLWADGLYLFVVTLFCIAWLVTIDVNSLSKVFSKQDKGEKSFESKLEKQFQKKFTTLASRPVISPFLRWFYTEGSFYLLFLAFVFILALVLRVTNLTILDPYTDEYSHLRAAKDLFETGTTDYTRAMLVTWLVNFSQVLGGADSFYEYIYWGRLPGVIVGALTTIPIYFLARKVSKNVGLVAAFLWAVSPWAIAVSRDIREYAFYPLLVLLVALIFMHLMHSLINFHRKYLPGILLSGFALLPFIYYVQAVDTQSTLKITFLLFPLIVLYYLTVERKKLSLLMKKHKKVFTFVLLSTIFLFAFAGYVALGTKQVSFDLANVQWRWLSFFFKPIATPMHWWYGNQFLYLVVLIFIIATIYSVFAKKKKYFLYALLFTTFIVFYLFFFNRYIRQRYSFYALPFFTIIVAVGFYGMWAMGRHIFLTRVEKWVAALVAVVFFVSVVNYKNVVYPVTSDEHGYVQTTYEHHDKVRNVITLMDGRIEDEDVFIATVFKSVLELAFDINEDRVYGYKYEDPERFDKMESVIRNHDQGWIILDWRQNGHWAEGLPKTDFELGGKKLFFAQQDGMHIYRWKDGLNDSYE